MTRLVMQLSMISGGSLKGLLMLGATFLGCVDFGILLFLTSNGSSLPLRWLQ